MKKSFIFKSAILSIVLVATCIMFAVNPICAYADIQINGQAKSAYLIDYDTGTVLYERNADECLPIASMVKIMTLGIAFDNIKKGNLSLDEKLVISEEASGMGGSQMFLDVGEEYTVSDLIKGITVCSANDASVAIAERISGTKEEFIALMNKRAKELGMENTVFVNVTGLPAEGQHSTAKDVSIMMKELLQNDAYFNYSKIYMEDYKHPDGRITGLVNTNKLIRFYKGCDAGKTGFTNQAMFCLSATAEKNGMRVISTVIGSPDSKSRFKEVSSMFDYAFAIAKRLKIVDKNSLLDTNIKVVDAKQQELKISAEKDVYCIEIKGEKEELTLNYSIMDNLKAPIKSGSKVGEIIVTRADGTEYARVNIITQEDIDKQTYIDALKEVLKNW